MKTPVKPVNSTFSKNNLRDSMRWPGVLAFLLGICLSFAGAGAQTAAPIQTRLTLEARLIEDGTPIDKGVEWRIFIPQAGADGRLPLLAQAAGGTRAFDITPGEYLVHAAYGHAAAVRRVVVAEGGDQRETVVLNAGGLQLSSVTSTGSRVPAGLLRFDVYEDEADERGVRQLIARSIRPNQIVPFPAGTYHVVSQYGDLNAEIRADLRVEPGKVTQATIEHRAARMTFRLVRTAGGDAIADTAWSILTEAGDVITESASAFPAFVLSEGSYTAIARNSEKIYSRDFTVISGVDQDVELLAE